MWQHNIPTQQTVRKPGRSCKTPERCRLDRPPLTMITLRSADRAGSREALFCEKPLDRRLNNSEQNRHKIGRDQKGEKLLAT